MTVLLPLLIVALTAEPESWTERPDWAGYFSDAGVTGTTPPAQP